MKRALVISGGGSKGAWAGGVAEYLIREKGYDYTYGVGASTGSILLPHLLINEIEQIKHIYTHVKARDIFTINPFKIKRVNGEYEVKLNHFNILKSFIKGSPTFGDSHRLLRKIRKEITFKQYHQLRELNKEVVIAVSNLTKQCVEYKSSQTERYADFIDWIWGSSNYVPFMSIMHKNGFEYADGGFTSMLPLRKAMNLGEVDEVDVIVLTPQNMEFNLPASTNAFQTLSKTYGLSMLHSFNKDLMLGQLKSARHNVKVNIYFTPKLLTEYPLVFDKQQMTEWWQQGYLHAKNHGPDELEVIPKHVL